MSEKESSTKRKGKSQGKGSRNNSRQNSPMRNEEEDSWKCEICTQSFSDPNAKMLECQRCEGHFCIKCLKKPEAEYNLLAHSDLMWFCVQCREKVEKNIAVDVEIETRCAEIMKAYEQRISKLESDMQDKCGEERVRTIVKEEISGQKALIGEQSGSGLAIAKENGDDVITSVFTEINERKQRENNIVVHGIPEMDSESAGERVSHDRRQIADILQTCTGSSDSKLVVKVNRLGKYDSENPKRPILATLSDSGTKRKLFQNIRKLGDAGPMYKEVRISNDFTKAEREQERKLVGEMKELQSQESGDFVYRIRGPPWARKIVKLKK